jgi:hypothetical protein
LDCMYLSQLFEGFVYQHSGLNFFAAITHVKNFRPGPLSTRNKVIHSKYIPYRLVAN